MTDKKETTYPAGGIAPEKLVGKDIMTVVDRMIALKLEHRVVRENGLITADFRPDRYTLMVNEDDIIIDAALG